MLLEQIDKLKTWNDLEKSTTVTHLVKLLTKEEKDRIYRKKRNLRQQEVIAKVEKDHPEIIEEVKKQFNF